MLPAKLEVNRLLTTWEFINQLSPFTRLTIPTENLNDNLSVVRLNSTYLETVDKYYAGRGVLTFLSMIFFTLFCMFSWANYYLNGINILHVISLLLLGAILYLFKQDAFGYTYYPIRFNRKTRMVYVFTRKGEVWSESWDKMFFNRDTWRPNMTAVPEHDIRGHQLASDGATVLNTVELGISADIKGDDLAYWEFIRRYMEEGAEAVSPVVECCLPVERQKTTFLFCSRYLYARGIRGFSLPLAVLFLPLTLCFSLGRYIAMRTSKSPQWPTEVEADCQIANDDPVNLSEKTNLPWNWRTGWITRLWWKRQETEEEKQYYK